MSVRPCEAGDGRRTTAEPAITVTPDPAFPLPAGDALGQARALRETARQTREDTLTMRGENQALLSRVRQQMFRPRSSRPHGDAAGGHHDVAVDAGTNSRTLPAATVVQPAATSSAGAPVLVQAGQGSVVDRTLAALRVLLRSSHLAGPDDLPALVLLAGAELGATRAVLYLVDYDQVLLVPLRTGQAPGAVLAAEGGASAGAAANDDADGAMAIGGTLAGRAYTELAQQTSTSGPGLTVWTPVLDGTERLGVLRLDYPAQDELEPDLPAGCEDVAALLAGLVMTRSLYGDAVERTRRRSPMTVPAELAWRALPPLTFVSPRVSVAGALAPAEQVGGDSFDYALNGDTLHVAIFDAMGHGLQAALLASVAVAALRNARRAGLDLTATVRAIDSTLSGHFAPGQFVTGIVAELDLTGGWWRWSTCGHPPTLLVRSGRVVKQLDAVTDPPLGLGLLDQPEIGAERLQPGDRLLLHTDGVSEARDSSGEFFGTERLVEFTSRQAAAGRPAAETLRRLNHAILDHQDGALQDDATTVMVEWLTDQPERSVPADSAMRS
ncbi:MAG TPA: PP2C family protein-serine/threonine phosphatase [Mycobacteriales bacterium]|nr:PP2C family protein-serine/threonine phosphatase [Mycobacteriales bacterium]